LELKVDLTSYLSASIFLKGGYSQVDKVLGIEEAIETKREELNEAGNRFGLCSKYVLRKSKELDDLLNEYNKKSMMIRAAK
jgi:hypothetical protein